MNPSEAVSWRHCPVDGFGEFACRREGLLRASHHNALRDTAGVSFLTPTEDDVRNRFLSPFIDDFLRRERTGLFGIRYQERFVGFERESPSRIELKAAPSEVEQNLIDLGDAEFFKLRR